MSSNKSDRYFYVTVRETNGHEMPISVRANNEEEAKEGAKKKLKEYFFRPDDYEIIGVEEYSLKVMVR